MAARGWRAGASTARDSRRCATPPAFTIYTPGSTSGVGLNVVGSLAAAARGHRRARRSATRSRASSSGLLGLVGIEADPLSSREHILLANIVQQSWANGQDLDLAGLVAQVQAPPLRKLGVFELDEFFPPADRTKLALRLNGLLASPAFAAWGQGDAARHRRAARARAASRAAPSSRSSHLSDEERQFVVTLVLSKLITWMRRQPGTDQLRALVYFDEVVGFVPPTAAPPAKAPILTILKQARAFGVGMVLATQNPVDVDYKALGNAGTWMIGRLQTEQDKARLLDGLSAAAGGVDTAAMSATIAGLDKREFVLRQAGKDAPTTFTSRWAMSYLRGPLTREQIATLMADRRPPPGRRPTARRRPTTSPHRRPRHRAATAAAPPLGDDSHAGDADGGGGRHGAVARPGRPVGDAGRARCPRAPGSRPRSWPPSTCSSTTPRRTCATRSRPSACCSRSPIRPTSRRSSPSTTTRATCCPRPRRAPPTCSRTAKLTTKATVHDGAAHDRRPPPRDPHGQPARQPRAEAGQPARRVTGRVRRALRRRRRRRRRCAGRRRSRSASRRGSSGRGGGRHGAGPGRARRRRRSRRSRPTSCDRRRRPARRGVRGPRQRSHPSPGRWAAWRPAGAAPSEAGQRVETASNRVDEKAEALADLEADMAGGAGGDRGGVGRQGARHRDASRCRSRSRTCRVSSLALVWIPV